ncbi:MAG: histone deacetylase family protein [Alphaproteobacteria bacterium]
MTTTLFTHTACLNHDNGLGHPESPDRLRAILAELDKPIYQNLLRKEAPLASRDDIARVHDEAYIEDVFDQIPPTGFVKLDADTSVSPGSGKAALRAAGAVIAAVDDVLMGQTTNAFCAVRPPGHHAEYATPMGFCLFGNIAIGAAHALIAHKIKHIAILDFDVHHGNGTEEWASDEEGVLFISSHQFPLWPGTGLATDRGAYGNILNLPLLPDTDGAGFRKVMREKALPAIDQFKPELIMISAGFDAHKDDPLAGLRLTEDDFYWITKELTALAQTHCQGRLVSSLEGGYDLKALAASAGAHIKALLEA